MGKSKLSGYVVYGSGSSLSFDGKLPDLGISVLRNSRFCLLFRFVLIRKVILEIFFKWTRDRIINTL